MKPSSSKLALVTVALLLAGCPQGQDNTSGSPSPANGASGAAQPASGAAMPASSTASVASSASGAAMVDTGGSSPAVANPKAHFDARGIYMTATSVEISRWKPMLQALKAAGGNTIIFDAKDEDGIVQWQSTNALSKAMKASKEGPIHDLKAKIKEAHDMGIHVAGRVCCFHDPILAHAHPELCPTQAKGGIWKELGSQAWVDPSKKVAQDYIIDLGKELASFGCDEVQFDYIRFPAMGDTQNARYDYDMTKQEKHDVITAFLARAYNEVHAAGPIVSCDVYGIMAWAQPIDVKITGQLMEDMVKHTDVICPMDYASHFSNGFDGIAHPADMPYMFVNNALRRLVHKVGGSGVVIRPWLQGMPYKVSNFNAHYITEQLKACQENKITGYMFWNAQNQYDTAFAGMKQFGGGGK